VIKDKLNKDLVKGDYVIVTCKGYRNMIIARVLKFTPKQVKVVYLDHSNYPQEYLTNEVIKIEPQDLDRIQIQTKVELDQIYEKKTALIA
jgi:phage portal protein BeeE